MAAETFEALQAAVKSEQEAIGSLRERLNAFGRALIGVSSDPSFFHSLHLLIVTRERLLEQATIITESGSLDDASWAERVHGQVMALADASKAYLSFTGHACAKAASDTGETIFASDIAASGLTADDFQAFLLSAVTSMSDLVDAADAAADWGPAGCAEASDASVDLREAVEAAVQAERVLSLSQECVWAGTDDRVPLVKENRVVVRQQVFPIMDQDDEEPNPNYTVWLFSDAIMYGAYTSAERYEIVGLLDLAEAGATVETAKARGKLRHSFKISHAKGSLAVVCASDAERDSWAADVERTIVRATGVAAAPPAPAPVAAAAAASHGTAPPPFSPPPPAPAGGGLAIPAPPAPGGGMGTPPPPAPAGGGLAMPAPATISSGLGIPNPSGGVNPPTKGAAAGAMMNKLASRRASRMAARKANGGGVSLPPPPAAGSGIALPPPPGGAMLPPPPVSGAGTPAPPAAIGLPPPPGAPSMPPPPSGKAPLKPPKGGLRFAPPPK